MGSATRKVACWAGIDLDCGSELGQAYEVEVRPGRLVVRAV